VFDEKFERRLGAGVKPAGYKDEPRRTPHSLRSRGVGERLPVAEEGLGAAVVDRRELVKVDIPRPPRKLETLGQLAAVEVAADAEDYYARLLVEGNDIGLTYREARPASDSEEALADDLLEALPDQIPDLARVDLGRSVHPSERD
jgi:hypothetical protein